MRDTFSSFRSTFQRRGFTLVEVLVVLTIIVLISLAALPAIRFITGSRSIESAQNLAGAMISRARGQALADSEPRGVFFFVDPANDRTTMALVGQGGGDFDQYLGWTAQSLPASNVRFDLPANTLSPAKFFYYSTGVGQTQSKVISLGTGAVGTFYDAPPLAPEYNSKYLGQPRSILRSYVCIGTHIPADATKPKLTTGVPNIWQTSSTALDIVADTDFQLLPAGVGVQLINSNPSGIANFDRYVRTGCIMFDRNGFFASIPWSVAASTAMGKSMHLATDIDLGNSLYSEFGLALYDRQTYLAQQSAKGGGNFPEGDFIFKPTLFQAGFGPNSYAAFADEDFKEKWIDNNSLPLLIDRYSGNLIKGE